VTAAGLDMTTMNYVYDADVADDGTTNERLTRKEEKMKK
jgi:hypothetical protein